MSCHIYFITIKSSEDGEVREEGGRLGNTTRVYYQLCHFLLGGFGASDRGVVEVWIGVWNSAGTEQAANTADDHQGREWPRSHWQGRASGVRRRSRPHPHHSTTESTVSLMTPNSVLAP